jgi:hypothetical protein
MNATVQPRDIGAVLAKHSQKQRAAMVRGLRSGARLGRTILVGRTPKDRGMAKLAWKTIFYGDTGVVAENLNSAPYSGILDSGARPHKVSWEAQFSIYTWVERHFRLSKGGALQPLSEGGTRLTARGSGAFKRSQNAAIGYGMGGERLSRAGSYVQRAILGTHPEYAGRLVPAALNITGAIVWKMMTKGQAPTWFVKLAMPELARAAREEVERCLKEIRS